MPPDLPLRDIHLPAPIGWWPPAPGWWLLLFGIPALLLLSVWLWRFLRRQTPKKLALREWEAIVRSDAAAVEKTRQLAILLRRVCLSVYPREEVAGLTGEAWLAFLDAPLKHKGFSEGVGRLLLDTPYRRDAQLDVEALAALCREWLNSLPRSGPPRPRPSPETPKAAPPTPAAAEQIDPDPRRFAKPPADEGQAP